MSLQNKKIEINQQDEKGYTAFMWASKEGHKDIVEMLLQDERIDTNQLDSDIALMFASKKDHKEIAKLLIIKYYREEVEIFNSD